ncbi:MAG: YjfB family protein [Mobilitalea sp.]
MTIASLPISTNTPLSNTPIGMAVLAKSLDSVEQSGQGIIQMMEQSVNPNLGKNIDMQV